MLGSFGNVGAVAASATAMLEIFHILAHPEQYEALVDTLKKEAEAATAATTEAIETSVNAKALLEDLQKREAALSAGQAALAAKETEVRVRDEDSQRLAERTKNDRDVLERQSGEAEKRAKTVASELAQREAAVSAREVALKAAEVQLSKDQETVSALHQKLETKLARIKELA